MLANDLAHSASFPFFYTGPLSAQPSLFMCGLLRASWPTGAIQPRTPRGRVHYELKIPVEDFFPFAILSAIFTSLSRV
jgi:hypothetical protein